jgi:hypothetical protein
MNDEELDEEIRRKEISHTRFLLSYPLLIPLLILLVIDTLLFIFGYTSIAFDVPLIMVIAGIVVIFFGSFSDFGAKKYIENVMIAKASLKEKDVVGINKEQLFMNLIYIAIGSLYIGSGFLINFLMSYA